MEDTIVIISMYANPLHCGHLDYIEAAKKLGTQLIVIVNSDYQVDIKGSKPFMNENDRLRILDSLKCVDLTVLSHDTDGSVTETVKNIFLSYPSNYKFIFANGGDRKEGNVPEDEYCKSVGIELVYGVGGEKTQSSSELLKGI